MNKRKFKRAFTLMELMIVIVIIGILATVGMVMFGGQAEKAKIATTKTNHNNVVKKVALTIMDCNMNGSVKMMSKPNNTTSYNINCYGKKFTFFADYLINDMDNQGRWKNPYKDTGNRVQQPGWCANAKSGDANVGFVWINARDNMDHVTVCTCTKTPCSDDLNILEKNIPIG